LHYIYLFSLSTCHIYYLSIHSSTHRIFIHQPIISCASHRTCIPTDGAIVDSSHYGPSPPTSSSSSNLTEGIVHVYINLYSCDVNIRDSLTTFAISYIYDDDDDHHDDDDHEI